jgi:hypothetical protein
MIYNKMDNTVLFKIKKISLNNKYFKNKLII